MIYESNISTNVNRRNSKRVPCQGEAILRWSHDFDTPVRYGIADRSAEGTKIISQIPLAEGMTGVITRYLPKGEEVHQPMMVAWSSSTPDKDGYHCGVWFFGTEQ